MEQDLVLTEEDVSLLNHYLTRFVEDTAVRVVMLMGREGHLLTVQGEYNRTDIESFCALSVGAFASSEALARLAGESTFSSIYHQGVRCNVYISMVGDSHLMLALFDYHASAPLVRLQARMTSEAIVSTLDRVRIRASSSRRAIEADAAAEPKADAPKTA